MTLHPGEKGLFWATFHDLGQQLLPEVLIGHSLALGVLPASSEPTLPPFVGKALHHIGAIGAHFNNAVDVVQRAQGIDDRIQLHALVGTWLF